MALTHRRLRRLLALALAVALMAGGAPAQERVTRLANLRLKETTRPYAIAGRSAGDLGAELRRHGVLAATPDGYRSPYVWQMQWMLEPRATAAGCAVGRLDVELVSILSLPQWTAPAGAPASLKADWSRFESALRAHEWQHRNMTVSRAQQFAPRVAHLTAQSCDSLRRGVDYLGQQWTDALRQANDDYDAKTAHGAGQGVRWPPAAPAR